MKPRDILFVFILLFLSAGCGKYLSQYSSPVILTRNPVLYATGIGSGEVLWFKFSKSMDTSDTGYADLAKKFVFAPEMTATQTTFEGITPEVFWSDSDTRLNIKNVFFIANPGNRVRVTASKEGFSDTNGQFLTEGTLLWDYNLSGLNIVSRDPVIGSTEANVDRVLSATFNNPVDTSSFVTGEGVSHTAGAPVSMSSPIWSNGDTTVTIEVTGWTNPSSVVDITYEAVDVYGNLVTNGQLFKYNLQ